MKIFVPIVTFVSISVFAQSFLGKPNVNQCFQDSTTLRNSIIESNQLIEYPTIEQARMALRDTLLDYSKECKKTSIIWRDRGYPEVGGYVVKNSNGSFGITVSSKGSNKSINMSKPDNAVESMHTHPFQVSNGEGTALGLSGRDILTSMQQGIPAFALDCASGDVFGVTEKGEAIKLVCNESEGTCYASQVSNVESDWMFIAGFVPEKREYSQDIANERLNSELSKMTMNGNDLASSQSSQNIDFSVQRAAAQTAVGERKVSSHYCTSFKHVKTRTVKVASIAAEHGNWQVYQCTECGRQTGFYDKDDSIENVIAENKRKQAIENQSLDAVNEVLQRISTKVTVPAGSAQGDGHKNQNNNK